MPYVVWARKSKTGVGFKIGSLQKKLWRCPNVPLMGNPAVVTFFFSSDNKQGQLKTNTEGKSTQTKILAACQIIFFTPSGSMVCMRVTNHCIQMLWLIIIFDVCKPTDRTLLISPWGNFPYSFSCCYWESMSLLRGNVKMSIPSDRKLSSVFSVLKMRNTTRMLEFKIQNMLLQPLFENLKSSWK